MNKDTEQIISKWMWAIICTYCGKPINGTVTYDEDAEPAHEQCIKNFEKHWEDRQEMMDLMGY